jgi:hypothetical protein
MPMKSAEDGWTAAFVPSAPGAWQVTVEATGLTGQSAPRIKDIVAVIDPGDGGHGDGSREAAVENDRRFR